MSYRNISASDSDVSLDKSNRNSNYPTSAAAPLLSCAGVSSAVQGQSPWSVNYLRTTLFHSILRNLTSPSFWKYKVYADSQGFLLAGTSNESGVVDDGNFWRFEWNFFGNFRDKASNII